MDIPASNQVFDFTNYREYLKIALPCSGPNRGSRNRLAEALNCQKGFVSQVLGGRAHLSLEHGVRISKFLKHDPAEEEFFLLLLHLGRAGSVNLETFYRKRIAEILEHRNQIKDRIHSRSDLSESEQMTYYSSWHYTATHMCLMVPELRTRQSIGEFLGLPPEKVSEVLSFLEKCGLAQQKGTQYEGGPTRIHLPADSPIISKHHTNWRIKAIEALDRPKKENLHYSLIMSVSEEAAEKIRRILLDTIQHTEPIMKEAQDQTVYALNIDLFGLGR